MSTRLEFQQFLDGVIKEGVKNLKDIAANRPSEWKKGHSKILKILLDKHIPGAEEILKLRQNTGESPAVTTESRHKRRRAKSLILRQVGACQK